MKLSDIQMKFYQKTNWPTVGLELQESFKNNT